MPLGPLGFGRSVILEKITERPTVATGSIGTKNLTGALGPVVEVSGSFSEYFKKRIGRAV